MERLTEEGIWQLPDQAILCAQGRDALPFLSGQLTRVVDAEDASRACPSAYCTAQGRLLANGALWTGPDQSLRWMVSCDLADSLIQRLQRFVLRQDVTLQRLDALTVLGASGLRVVPAELHAAPPWTHARIGAEEWVVAPQSVPGAPAAWCITSQPGEAAATAASWNVLRLAAGWPSIRKAATEQFLPSALDLDLNGTIDFHKGCYPGQEVIARMHYRGTVKRRLAVGHCADPGPLPSTATGPGDLYPLRPNGAPAAGRIIESVIHEGRLQVAAEVSLADRDDLEFRLGGPTGPVLVLHLVHEPAAGPG